MANSSEPADQNSSHHSNLGDENLNLTAIGDTNLRFDQGFTRLVYFCAVITIAVLFAMSWVIFSQALPAIKQFGLGFLWGKDWDTGNKIFGALPYIYGTLVSSAIAILLAVPVGIAVALVTSENFLALSLRTILAFVVELIAFEFDS